MKQQPSGRPRRQAAPASPPAPPPQVRRYAHPIARSTAQGEQCPALRSVLCALAGQNQVLCAMKTELDEILALLRETQAGSRNDPT